MDDDANLEQVSEAQGSHMNRWLRLQDTSFTPQAPLSPQGWPQEILCGQKSANLGPR